MRLKLLQKICILRQEYLSSAVNGLAISLKISDQSKAVFFQLNLPGIHGKKGWRWCLATSSSVCNPLTRWLQNGVLKQEFLTFQYQPLSETIISEIIPLGHSCFFSNCSKFHAHFRNAIKIPEKVFRFWAKSVWSCCRKFSILRQEYLSSAVNVLANSLKIFDQSSAVFF